MSCLSVCHPAFKVLHYSPDRPTDRSTRKIKGALIKQIRPRGTKTELSLATDISSLPPALPTTPTRPPPGPDATDGRMSLNRKKERESTMPLLLDLRASRGRNANALLGSVRLRRGSGERGRGNNTNHKEGTVLPQIAFVNDLSNTVRVSVSQKYFSLPSLFIC